MRVDLLSLSFYLSTLPTPHSSLLAPHACLSIANNRIKLAYVDHGEQGTPLDFFTSFISVYIYNTLQYTYILTYILKEEKRREDEDEDEE